jgi:LacI family transcriptional regulator
VDNRRGAYEGVHHLIEHGHGRVLCIAGPGDVPAAVDREDGWRSAMAEAGLSTERLVIRTGFSRWEGYAAARAVLARTRRPTAIFASSDLQGIGVLRACEELDLGVPQDVAVLAFDGTQESEFTSPPLTVIQQDIQTIAETGVSVLLSQEPPGQPAHVIAPCRLVIRRSCGC